MGPWQRTFILKGSMGVGGLEVEMKMGQGPGRGWRVMPVKDGRQGGSLDAVLLHIAKCVNE